MKIGSVLVMAAVTLPAACSDGGGTSADVGSDRPAVSTSPLSRAMLVPPGMGDATFTRVVRREEAIAAGFDPAVVDEILGDRGVVQFTIRLMGPRYAQYQRNDDGPAELGDEGRQYVDDDGHLVWVSDSPGAPGGPAVVDWSVDGDELTMTCVAGCLRDVAQDANLVVEGTWTKSG